MRARLHLCFASVFFSGLARCKTTTQPYVAPQGGSNNARNMSIVLDACVCLCFVLAGCLVCVCACIQAFLPCPAQRQQMPPEQCTSIEAKASARFSWPHIVECVIWLETQLWMKRRRVSLNLQSQTQNPEPQTIHAFIEPKLLSTGSRPHARKP